MKTPLILILILLSSQAFGQKKNNKNYLISYVDSTSGKELIGYKSLKGDIIIKSKYQNGSDTLFKMAIVMTSQSEFVGIDRNDKIILKPYIYDNGPDYFEEGLIRFVENNKIGFANQDGQKIIKAKYSFATPFEDGISVYYIGGERIYDNGKTQKQINQESGAFDIRDLHWTWGGEVTEGGYLNKYGQEFQKVTELINCKRDAWTKDGKHYQLNQKGQLLKN